ncbi:DIRC2-like protein [Mya arenaria]|uniref:DIRC2-like protein n=1 Tax=Mya arenaria TaxID=6604 RepID=A0ABY7FAB5_MYAAR|nr:DIRC2-like protein [Mya arenaria]
MSASERKPLLSNGSRDGRGDGRDTPGRSVQIENADTPSREDAVRVGSARARGETHVYATRWWLLLVTSLCVTMQNAVWGTWGPLSKSAKVVYGWHTTMLTVVINCGNAGVLLPLLGTGYLVSRKGLRVSMLTSSFLLAVGSGLRTISTQPLLGTILVCVGQFCNGAAGSVLQVIPPALSETWFPSNERTTATAIAVVANSLGSVIAFTVGPNMVDQPKNTNWTLLNSTCDNCSERYEKDFGVCIAMFVLVAVYFPAKPPLPPSRSAKEERLDYRTGLKSVITQPSLLLLTAVFAVPWAVLANWMGLMSVNFGNIGVSQKEAGFFGMYAACGGLVGGILIGRIADRFPRRLKQFIVALFILTLLVVAWITCMRNAYIPKSLALLAVGVTVIASLMNGALPLCYELACESGFPIHEGIVSTFISIAINAAAVIFLLLVNQHTPKGNKSYNYREIRITFTPDAILSHIRHSDLNPDICDTKSVTGFGSI